LKAQTTDEPILFIDAIHPTQATKISGGWIKKGQDKAIKTTGSRTRLNIVGAVELNNISAAIVNRQSIKSAAKAYKIFLKPLGNNIPLKGKFI